MKTASNGQTKTVKLPKSNRKPALKNSPMTMVDAWEKKREIIKKINKELLGKIDSFFHYDASDTRGAGYGIGFIGEKLVSFRYDHNSEPEFGEISLSEALKALLEMKSAEVLLGGFCAQHDDEGEIKFFKLLQSHLAA